MINHINSRDRTYNWQLQPYVSWKGNNYNQGSLINSRPETNGSWILSKQISSSLDGNAFLPRPIKHWRKQLSADKIRGGTENLKINEIDRPGVYTTSVSSRNCCDVSNNSYSIVSNIQQKNNSTIYDDSESTITYADVSNCWNGPVGKRICCNPEANIITYKTTPLERNYISYSYYFKNRCVNYNQNISTTKVQGNTYFNSNGIALYPTNSSNSCQVLQKTDCANNYCNCGTNSKVQNTIYKPNNRQFAKQGATSSKSRINAMRENTIDQGGALFNNAYGLQKINNGICGLNGDSVYYVKTKPVAPQCSSNCINKISPTGPTGPTGPTALTFYAANNDNFQRCYNVTYANGVWIAVGIGNYTISRSTDGINWSSVNSQFESIGHYSLYSDNKWVAVGYVGYNPFNTSSILYSINNGIDWLQVNKTFPYKQFTNYGIELAYGNNRWVAVGSGDYTILTSTNGIDWLPVNTTPPYNQFTIAGLSVKYANGLWVAVGSGDYPILTSTNGTDWLPVNTQFSSVRSINYGNGLWVAVGYGSYTIMTSTNGTDWLPVNTTPPYTDFNANGNLVEYANGLWVAVGKGPNTILYSTNGTDWLPVNTTPPYTQFSDRGFSLSYANGLWVAVGLGDNNILTSVNGINWEVPNGQQFSDFGLGANYSNGRWVVVGQGQNGILYSN